MDEKEARRDAVATARDAVANGFFETWSLVDDEEPYYGDVESALLGTIYGDDHLSRVEPWPSDVEGVPSDLLHIWEEAWRDELLRLGRIELGRREGGVR